MMRHSEKIERIMEIELKKRKVMKMSRFLVEIEKKRFCEEVTKYIEEKKKKSDPFLFENDQLIYLSAKRTKHYLSIIGTDKQSNTTYYYKQFTKKEYFENEKQILHLFKPIIQNNPFLDLVQMDNSRMLLKKQGCQYSLIDYAQSIQHDWNENELLFIFERLLKIACVLKKEGIYLGDYNIENICLEELGGINERNRQQQQQQQQYSLKLINCDKAIQKKSIISYNLENEIYNHPLVRQKTDHLSIYDMESNDIWSILRCIILLICRLDNNICLNSYNNMIQFINENIQQQYPELFLILSLAMNISINLFQNQNYQLYNNSQQNNNRNLQKQQYNNNKNGKHISFQDDNVIDNIIEIAQCFEVGKEWLEGLDNMSFEGILKVIEKQKRRIRKYNNCLINDQIRRYDNLNDQISLYELLMRAHLYQNAIPILDRLIQSSNSVNQRDILIYNLDYIYCLSNTQNSSYEKGKTRLNQLNDQFLKYIQFDFQMLYKYALAIIVYDIQNSTQVFGYFPQIISDMEEQNNSHMISLHYLFYLLQCQLVYRYLQNGKAELGLMYNQIAIDYAYENIINYKSSINQKQYTITASKKHLGLIPSSLDNFTEEGEQYYDLNNNNSYLSSTKQIQKQRNIDDEDFSQQIKNKLQDCNLGVCEDNIDLIGQYLFLMEEYELGITKITDLQTRAACLFYQEKYSQATQIYEGLKDMIHFQSDPSIYLALGLCNYLMEDYEKGYQYCQQALNICDRQDHVNINDNSNFNLHKNKPSFTKGEEEVYREFKARLDEININSSNYFGKNEQSSKNNNIKQQRINSPIKQQQEKSQTQKKQEKRYQKIYEEYNLKASAVVLKAFCEIEIERSDSALHNMEYAIDHFNRVGLHYEKIDMIENMAFIYFKLAFVSPNSPKQALQLSLEGYNSKLKYIQLTQRINIEVDFPDTFNIISLSYYYGKDLSNAIKYAEQSLELLLEFSDLGNEQLLLDQDEQSHFIQERDCYFTLLWKQYLYIAYLYDNAYHEIQLHQNINYKSNINGSKYKEQKIQSKQNKDMNDIIQLNDQVIENTQKSLKMIGYCGKTVGNGEEESKMYLLIGECMRRINYFEEAIRYYVKAADVAEILSKENNIITSRFHLLHIQSLSFALSVYTSAEYNSQPENGNWCATKLEHSINRFNNKKYELLPKYYLQLSQYLDLVNETPKAIEFAKTAALLHNDIYPVQNHQSYTTLSMIYHTLISMLQSSKRFQEAESYTLQLQKLS